MRDKAKFKALAQVNRAYLAEVWRKSQKDPDSLSEDERILADLMHMHPEYARYWEAIEHYGNHYFDPSQEANPFLHVSLHMTVEKQIRLGTPDCVLATMQRLVARGEDAHDARHAIMRVLARRLCEVATGRARFDVDRYVEDLENL